MNSLLPPSATPAMRALELADATALDALDIDQLATLGTPHDCPIGIVPFLAWAFSVDTWSEDWSDAAKRAVAIAALGVHTEKGTRGAVEDAIEAFGGGISITEWWQQNPAGTPHTFRLDVLASANEGDSFLRALLDTVDQAKPLRDHYTPQVRQTGTGGIELAAAGSGAMFRAVGGSVTYHAAGELTDAEFHDGSAWLLHDDTQLQLNVLTP